MNTRFAPESDIDKSIVLGAKPFKHIEKIIDNVLPHAERSIIARGEIIHYCSGDTRQCFYCCMAAWRCTVAGTVSS